MRKLAAFLLVAVMVLSLAACGKSDEGRTFKHGFDLDFPPYSHLNDDGSVSGFDVELCQAVCEKLGWKYEAVPFNWDVKDAELNAGSCDCIWSGFTINGREDDYCWSRAPPRKSSETPGRSVQSSSSDLTSSERCRQIAAFSASWVWYSSPM